jgi:hypothetical protein
MRPTTETAATEAELRSLGVRHDFIRQCLDLKLPLRAARYLAQRHRVLPVPADHITLRRVVDEARRATGCL